MSDTIELLFRISDNQNMRRFQKVILLSALSIGLLIFPFDTGTYASACLVECSVYCLDAPESDDCDPSIECGARSCGIYNMISCRDYNDGRVACTR